MGRNYGSTIEEHYCKEVCPVCINQNNCKKSLQVEFDALSQTTTLKCAGFEKEEENADES